MVPGDVGGAELGVLVLVVLVLGVAVDVVVSSIGAARAGAARKPASASLKSTMVVTLRWLSRNTSALSTASAITSRTTIAARPDTHRRQRSIRHTMEVTACAVVAGTLRE
jgi:hypothetical protein